MANHKSAIKRHRQSLKRKMRNKSVKSGMKTQIKSFFSVLETGEKDAVQKLLPETVSKIAKTASRGIIKKKTASRKISKLAKKANSILQAQT